MIELTTEERDHLLDYLSDFPKGIEAKARSMALSGMVRHLRRKMEGFQWSFIGTVQDRGPCEVTLAMEEFGLEGYCDCKLAAGCVHCAALAHALIAFSPKSAAKPVPKAAPVPKPKPVHHLAILRDAVTRGLGRPPSQKEEAFLGEVFGLFEAARRVRSINLLELSQLAENGREQYMSMFETVQAWPEYPDSILEFWHGLSHEAAGRQLRLPEFMSAVARVTPPSETLTRHWRQRAVNEWIRKLETAELRLEGEPDAHAEPQPAVDFRIQLKPGEAILERRDDGSETWKPLRKGSLRELALTYLEKPFPVVPEAELLWEQVARRLGMNIASGFNREPEEALLQSLPALLARSGLESRIVTSSGVPFLRPEGRLQWKLTAPSAEHDDYRFELVRPDGQPPGEVLRQLSGTACWVVTTTEIWRAAPIPAGFSPFQPTLVPADAVESHAGLRLIGRLKTELPERLRERVCDVHLQPVIWARIGDSPETEDTALFCLQAKAPDGTVVERYSLGTWSPVGKLVAPGKRVLVVHRERLEGAPEHLARLGAKRHPLGLEMSLRLTKSFPEQFVQWARSLPSSIRLELDPALRTLLEDPVKAAFGLKLEPAGTDWFDLAIQVDVGSLELSPEELRLLLNARGGYVRLGEKGWKRLEYSLSEEDEQQLARIGLDARDFTGEKQRLHALQLSDDTTTRFLPERQAEEIRRRAGEIQASVTPPVPAEIQARLRPYQVEGFHFLAYLSENRFGGVLADDMGLGKTLQTLTWMSWLRGRMPAGGRARFLIVCPKSVAPNWQSELGRFLPKWRSHVWRGDSAVSLETAMKVADVLVVNYAQLRRLQEPLEAVQWNAVVLDEAQAIKNPESQTAQGARRLKADHRLALTGTPIENRLLDLWSILAFAMPGVLGNRAQFQRSFGSAEDPLARRRLAARVRPFLLRRTKSQVAQDLPDRVEEDLSCEMEGVQKHLYDAEFKKARALLLKVQTKTDLDQFRFHFLTSLLRLRQICCHPALVDDTQRKAESAKMDALFDLLEPLIEEGQKVLIFSQFVSMLDLLREEITARGWTTFYIAGHTDDRSAPVSGFQSHVGGAVFLISIKAGGFGLNLTAASYVILYDPWWNPAVEAQAIDRTHRIGQTQKVIAYRLITQGSIEEKIRALQQQKKAVAEDILGEERFSQSLTVDDFRYLFEEPAADPKP